MIEELFAPGRKHTDEERKRLELTRVDLNDGDPGRGPIDLASGKVVVRLPTQAGDETEREVESDPAATLDQAPPPTRDQVPAPTPDQAQAPDHSPSGGQAPAPEQPPA
ncbi:DUF6191 domain-containing protein [Streptomyces phaeochromogenes]